MDVTGPSGVTIELSYEMAKGMVRETVDERF
jgi:hypothetical protein